MQPTSTAHFDPWHVWYSDSNHMFVQISGSFGGLVTAIDMMRSSATVFPVPLIMIDEVDRSSNTVLIPSIIYWSMLINDSNYDSYQQIFASSDHENQHQVLPQKPFSWDDPSSLHKSTSGNSPYETWFSEISWNFNEFTSGTTTPKWPLNGNVKSPLMSMWTFRQIDRSTAASSLSQRLCTAAVDGYWATPAKHIGDCSRHRGLRGVCAQT